MLNALYAVRNQMVVFDELVFRSAQEFRAFMEQLLSTGKENPAYLRRFVREHEKALAALNNVSTLTSAVTPVITAGNSVIELDEYVFRNAAAFAGFAKELADDGHDKPLRGADFIREHKAGLEALKSTEALAPAVKELQALEHAGEKSAAIMVNGIRYTPMLFNPESVKQGGYIKFGSYPQENGNTREPIEWLVLEVNGNEAFLVSRYGLDCRQYHHACVSMTWEQCDLRKWLNHDFLEAAFTEEEQRRIKVSEVVNDNSRQYDTRGGNNTRDRVFCLSLAEAEQYFENDSERRCRPTAQAKAHGAYVSAGCCYWWLRSPGLFGTALRTWLRAARYTRMVSASTLIATPCGPLYG